MHLILTAALLVSVFQPQIDGAFLTQKGMASVQQINNKLLIYPDKRLGSGAFGVVFKGKYNNAPCAVKVLHSTATELQTGIKSSTDYEANKAFERECRLLESFDHPNIVKHLSTDKHPLSGNIFLVYELMDCNLRSYLSGIGEAYDSLTSQVMISLSKDVTSGLAYIHSRQIIHRDLCGDNILLLLSTPVPMAKIADFGMSRLLDSSQMSTTLTALGHRMGYLPPEAPRMEDEKYDFRLDVFSLGVIMVQIACRLETVKSAKDRSFYVMQIPETHILKPLIRDCLQEDMRKRPSASDICKCKRYCIL